MQKKSLNSEAATCKLADCESRIGELDLKTQFFTDFPAKVPGFQKEMVTEHATTATWEALQSHLNTFLLSRMRSRTALCLELYSAGAVLSRGESVIRELSKRICTG